MTYNPVKIINNPKTGVFSGLPSAVPGAVLVVDREGHPVRVLHGPNDRLTAGEARWGRIRTLYEVDVTEHRLDFKGTFPCKDDIGGFQATVTVSCQVIDPEAVVARGIIDVAGVLIPPVTETLRRVCGDFPAEDFQQAEKAGLAAIRTIESRNGHDRAFRISGVHLVLALDQAAAAYVRDRKESARNLIRQQDTARLDQEKARLEAELALARDQLAAERERAAAQIEHDRLLMESTRQQLEGRLADQRQELELTRAALRARTEQKDSNQLELDRLEFEKTRQEKQAELDAARVTLDLDRDRLQARYDMEMLEAKMARDRLQVTELTGLLSRGQYAALAMRLAQDPTAIGAVSNYLMNQRSADINRQLRALELLIENDSLEGWQITDQAKVVLRQLISNWSEHSGQLGIPTGDAPAEIESQPTSDPSRSAQPGSPTTAEDDDPPGSWQEQD